MNRTRRGSPRKGTSSRERAETGTAWKIAFAVALCTAIGSLFVLAGAILTSRPGHTAGQPSFLPDLPGLPSATTTNPSNSSQRPPPSQPTPAATPNPATLRALDEALRAYDEEGTSVVVYRLSDGLETAINPGDVYYAASLYKLAVLYQAELERSRGDLDITAALYLSDADAAEDLGTLGSVAFGEDGSISFAEALNAMITISDNALANALMHHFTSSRIDETLRGLGLKDTSLNTEELPTTAADMSRLMSAVVTGAGVDAESREHMRILLASQQTRFGIPALLPDGIVVGNKTGTWPGALHDVAHVDAPSGTYVIAILTDGTGGWEYIARISLAVYEALETGA